MTRQMADDEVLRVLDDAAYELHNYTPDAPQPMRDVRDYVAALQAERDALRAASIGATDKPQAERIEARELRKQRLSWINHVQSVGCTYVATIGLEGEPIYALVNTRAERAESALEALRGQVEGLVDDFGFHARGSGHFVGARESFAYCTEKLAELLAIKERMG